MKDLFKQLPESSEEKLKASLVALAPRSVISTHDFLSTMQSFKLDLTMHEVVTLARYLEPTAKEIRLVNIFRLLGIPV